MRITSVAAALSADLPHGTKLEAMRGKITKVNAIKRGHTDAHGDWSLQNVTLQDSTGTITLVLKNRQEIGADWQGCTVLIEAQKDGKNKLSGLETEDHEYNGNTTRRVLVRGACTIGDGSEVPDQHGGQGQGNQGTAPPPGRGGNGQQQAPQQQRQQAPAPRPGSQQRPDFVQEERQYQQQNGQQGGQHTGQQRQQQDKPELTPQQRIDAAKLKIASITTLYTLCHDAAVMHASAVYTRHNYIMPPEAIGTVATTLFIEANKKNITCPHGDPGQLPAPKYPLGALLNERLNEQQTGGNPRIQQQDDTTGSSPQDLAQQPDQQW